jgi:hypothetical protein
MSLVVRANNLACISRDQRCCIRIGRVDQNLDLSSRVPRYFEAEAFRDDQSGVSAVLEKGILGLL